ncbi:MAG: DUF2461 domain-containing protein [Saprospiraceae bacterium]|nr:DUF2461 domain-containing protein [Saprospiraceae bacterium]
MAYFDENFLKFFKSLNKNNHKEWFNKNKSTYEASVKKPFEKLVADLIFKMQKLHPGFQCEVKDAVFRINRDIRFSKDKTPYKTNVSAVICHGGRKNMTNPGLYLELAPGNLSIYGGVYQPDKEQLSKIRTAIATSPKEIKKLKADKKFSETFGHIKGEVNKVLPPEFKEAAKVESLIANKQFYFNATYNNDQLILADDLVPFIMKHYAIGLPWSNFLSNALRG